MPAASHFFCAGSLLYSWNTIDTKATHNNQVKMIRISLPAAPLTSTVPCSLSWRSHCDSDSQDNHSVSIINAQQQKKETKLLVDYFPFLPFSCTHPFWHCLILSDGVQCPSMQCPSIFAWFFHWLPQSHLIWNMYNMTKKPNDKNKSTVKCFSAKIWNKRTNKWIKLKFFTLQSVPGDSLLLPMRLQ